ncbi:MAG TPA: V-type ATPase 116kDa subunit family protein [Candidatus Kryptonia bacterium]|nr:V-type ATPase 116kDa subunit family protein [Candidatus Kryptonia bacterium]
MLSPEPMRHLSLVVLTSDLEAASRAIARIGVLHLLDVRHAVETLSAIRPYDVRERLAHLLALAQQVGGLLKFLGIETPEETPAVPEDGADLPRVEVRLGEIVAEVDALKSRMAAVVEKREQVQVLLRNVRAVEPLGVPFEDLQGLRYVYVVSGRLPERNLTRLSESLGRIPHLIVPAGASDADGRVLVTVLCLRAHQDAADRALTSAQLERLEVPAQLAGTKEQAIGELEAELRATRETQSALEAERAALGQRVAPELHVLAAVVERERLLVESRGLMGGSERVALITGWVPAELSNRLEQTLRAATGGRCVIQWREPTALEDVRRGRVRVPILLHNPVLIRPFERLLRNYGMPLYGEVDPTAVVAVAFLAMFGFMFGDVGHGAVLFAIGYFIFRRMFRYRDYAVILMECGVASAVFGVLYGSVFGVEDWLPALWLRPMQETGRLMRAALTFGIVFISIGIGLNVVNAVRRHELAALWERNGLIGALAYWTAVGLFMRRLVAGEGAVSAGSAIMWLSVPVALMLLKAPLRALWTGLRTHKWLSGGDLLTAFVESMVEVLDTMVSTISNTATFIRLAAFALSHAGLFLATFSVASAVARMGGGGVGAALVMVLGNVVIIALEGLIVSIQTVRLEYYEFFSRFYSGGGEEYRPLRIASAHRQAA